MHTAQASGGPAAVLRGRLGRRLFLLFVACAIVPLLLFAWQAASLLSSQLHKDSESSLHDSVKQAGMSVAGRLLQLRDELDAVREEWQAHGERTFRLMPATLLRRLQGEFRSLTLHDGKASTVLAGDEAVDVPVFDADSMTHLANGMTLLHRTRQAATGGPWRMALVRRMAVGESGALLVAEIQDGVLWNAEELGAPRVDVVVYDRDFTELFSTFAARPSAEAWQQLAAAQPAGGTFEWTVDAAAHLGCYWRLFVKPQFGADLWVVHSRPRERVLGPLAGFLDTFLMVAVATFCCVVLASVWQLRRTMRPIADLHRATEAIADGNLGTIVAVDTPDEIGDLARAFNRMTANLLENIQRRERSERELHAAHEQALAAARAKADFLTNVSHEFRTPLAAVISMAEVLLVGGGDDDPAVRVEFTAGIVDRARHLESLIEKVLDLTSRGERRAVRCDVPATLRLAIAAVPPAGRTRIRLDVMDGIAPVIGEPDRLAALWGHLLDNALKFSDETSKVEVSVLQAGDRCIVEVTDHGCGIPAEQQPRIFDPFHQVTADNLTDKVPGTGLGLTLALEIVRQHAGVIEVDSSPGKGARFRVRLPVAPLLVLAAAPG